MTLHKSETLPTSLPNNSFANRSIAQTLSCSLPMTVTIFSSKKKYNMKRLWSIPNPSPSLPTSRHVRSMTQWELWLKPSRTSFTEWTTRSCANFGHWSFENGWCEWRNAWEKGFTWKVCRRKKIVSTGSYCFIHAPGRGLRWVFTNPFRKECLADASDQLQAYCQQKSD